MLFLALDTATRRASVAVFDEAQLRAQRDREVTTHSESLLSLIDQTLGQAGCELGDLDAVVCGRGPGSFTGLRIGLATAKGLCLAADKPLICLSSLLPVAAAVAEVNESGSPLVAVLLDARRQELFCGLFRDGRALQDETVGGPLVIANYLQQQGETLILAGDGALLYTPQLLERLGSQAALAPADCHLIQARYFAAAARARLAAGELDDLATAVPHYIRASDARLPLIISDRTRPAPDPESE